jgi:hypothetical protein
MAQSSLDDSSSSSRPVKNRPMTWSSALNFERYFNQLHDSMNETLHELSELRKSHHDLESRVANMTRLWDKGLPTW